MNRILRLLTLLLAGLVLTGHPAFSQTKADNLEVIKSLEYFAGDWHCEGKFTTSGKEISAKLHFESVLDGKFISFKHDDEPPFGYHAHAYWGWDKASGNFLATIHDSTGGTRLFRSSGWQGTTLEWTGGDLPAGANQRFAFERLEEKKFRVSYSYLKNDTWQLVDTSVCTLQPH
jgi:hypothetical protein